MKRIVVVSVCLLAALALAAPAGAAVVKAKVAGGTLTVTGTSKGNKITLRLKAGAAGKLVVDAGSNGTADFTFNRSSFAAIVVNAGAGNDAITISEKSGVFTLFENTTLNGGKGTDKLTGGTGAESYVGGPGKDAIVSKGGADVFFWKQGEGNDRVDGGAAVDQLNMAGTAVVDGFHARRCRNPGDRHRGRVGPQCRDDGDDPVLAARGRRLGDRLQRAAAGRPEPPDRPRRELRRRPGGRYGRGHRRRRREYVHRDLGRGRRPGHRARDGRDALAHRGRQRPARAQRARRRRHDLRRRARRAHQADRRRR